MALAHPVSLFKFIISLQPFEVNYHESAVSYLKLPELMAHELAQQMTAHRRATPPGEADAAAWEVAIDMDTNRPVWFPKDLADEYQRLRFTPEGDPRP